MQALRFGYGEKIIYKAKPENMAVWCSCYYFLHRNRKLAASALGKEVAKQNGDRLNPNVSKFIFFG